MLTLTQKFEQYLSIRRSLGFDLSFTERVLRKFTLFADERKQYHVTTQLFLDWKQAYGSANNETWTTRLSMVRCFAQWLANIDCKTEVPSLELFHCRISRPKPYIFTNEEIKRLLLEARKLESDFGLRGLLYQTLFGLISVTGLRINEALHLKKTDFDFERNLLVIAQSKSGSGRVLPFQLSTQEMLIKYAFERDRLLGNINEYFFLTERGTPPTDCSVRYNFAQVSQRVGLRSRQQYNRHGKGPRIHDLRHTFAVHTIVDWFKGGRDIDKEMYSLSTYLGHTKPTSTYWYIEAIPELMQLAKERAEKQYIGGDHD